MAHVHIDADGDVFFAVGSYEVEAGPIRSAVEYWVREGSEEPPYDRSRWSGTLPSSAPAGPAA